MRVLSGWFLDLNQSRVHGRLVKLTVCALILLCKQQRAPLASLLSPRHLTEASSRARRQVPPGPTRVLTVLGNFLVKCVCVRVYTHLEQHNKLCCVRHICTNSLTRMHTHTRTVETVDSRHAHTQWNTRTRTHTHCTYAHTLYIHTRRNCPAPLEACQLLCCGSRALN